MNEKPSNEAIHWLNIHEKTWVQPLTVKHYNELFLAASSPGKFHCHLHVWRSASVSFSGSQPTLRVISVQVIAIFLTYEHFRIIFIPLHNSICERSGWLICDVHIGIESNNKYDIGIEDLYSIVNKTIIILQYKNIRAIRKRMRSIKQTASCNTINKTLTIQ